MVAALQNVDWLEIILNHQEDQGMSEGSRNSSSTGLISWGP